MKTIAQKRLIFDQIHYQEIIEARGALIRRLTPKLVGTLSAKTALDVGCGIGFFAQSLANCGLAVQAFDGREINIQEARERYPKIQFQLGDIQDPEILALGSFDLVLCFGLLYHLENPFLAIRNLRSLTNKALLLESMCLPTAELVLQLREEPSVDDQSLTDMAQYPSEGALVKMLYRAGFAFVYRVCPMPDHEQFRETPGRLRQRTVLLASSIAVSLSDLSLYPEPPVTNDPWAKPQSPLRRIVRRARRFFAKTRLEKFRSLSLQCVRFCPLPLRLSSGVWWLARNDHVGRPILAGQFEVAETAFCTNFLRPGMTVLDIGAHHGFYTLLGAMKVGPTGRVYSFEPSTRERKALRQHVWLNHCKNVTIESLALGKEETEADLYVVNDTQTGCNSLRPPVVMSTTTPSRIRVIRLDDWIAQNAVERVDFIKLDVEGGELDVLKGADDLLERRPRPIIFVEVQDIRTQPWGYRAREIIRHVVQKNYRWFCIKDDGLLEPLDVSLSDFDGNFIACPEERANELENFISLPIASPIR